MIDELNGLQTEIDVVDDQLIALLAIRFARSRRIGVIKREAELPATDPQRIREQQRRFVALCISNGLNAEMAARLIETIIDQVVAERRTKS